MIAHAASPRHSITYRADVVRIGWSVQPNDRGGPEPIFDDEQTLIHALCRAALSPCHQVARCDFLLVPGQLPKVFNPSTWLLGDARAACHTKEDYYVAVCMNLPLRCPTSGAFI